MKNIFDSPRMAAGYTKWRPAVHRLVVEQIRSDLGWPAVDRALDLGCGAGLSTEPLLAVARRVVGLEVAFSMAAAANSRLPGASFVQANVEDLPFAPRTFQLVASAGSLNWCDLDAVLPRIAALVDCQGWFWIYDFGPGQLPGRAGAWRGEFAARYPFPPARRISPDSLPEAIGRLDKVRSRDFEFELICSRDFYLEYALTETNVEAAIGRGECEAEIRRWCSATLDSLLDAPMFPVRFAGYWSAYRARS